jgi:hypothetical protein
MKLNVFKVYSRSVHSYLLVLEAVATGESAYVIDCKDCDPQLARFYTVTLSALNGPWSAWNGTHTVTWKDNCNWWDSEGKLSLYWDGVNELWRGSLAATPSDTLNWRIVGEDIECLSITGGAGSGLPAQGSILLCTSTDPADCHQSNYESFQYWLSEHSDMATFKEEDPNIFVCFDDPKITAGSSSSSSSSSGSSLIALYTQCSNSSSSASSAPEASASLYQIYPNRMLVSIASLSDLDILPIDVPDDRLYRTSTVAMLFHSLSQLEAVLASIVSDVQVIARFQNYDIQVTETITSEDPVHDKDPGDLYNIP